MRLLSLLLLFALPAEAGPLSWVKRHPVASKLIVAGAASGVYAGGINACDIPRNCQVHYGPKWAGFGATVSLNLVGQLVGQKIGGKTGNAIAYGGSAAMLGWGVYQWHGGLNKEAASGAHDSFRVFRRDAYGFRTQGGAEVVGPQGR